MWLQGIIPPMFTPLDTQGRVMTDSAQAMAEYYVQQGVQGLYVLGSTGEAFTLRMEERRRMAELVVRQVGGRVPVIIQVGALSSDDAAELAAHAAECGADAISSVPPLYYAADARELRLHYATVAAACPLPFYLYHFPGITKAALNMGVLRALVAEIPSIAGLKFTDEDFLFLREALDLRERPMNILGGLEDRVPAFLAMGAHGVIGTLLAIIPRLYLELCAAWQAGDATQACALQSQANAVLRGVWETRPFACCKWLLTHLVGIDAGSTRLPNRGLTPEEEAGMPALVERLGLREWMTPA